MSATLPHPHACNPSWKTLRPAAIVDGTVKGMSNVSSFMRGATDGWPLVSESDTPPALYVPALLAAQPVRRATGSPGTRQRVARPSSRSGGARRAANGETMTEDLAYEGAVQEAAFAVHADPPWLLHLSGELDLATAPALSVALEDPIRLGGTIGLDLTELTYMDSTGIRVIFDTVRLLGERGRVVCSTLHRSFDASSRCVASSARSTSTTTPRSAPPGLTERRGGDRSATRRRLSATCGSVMTWMGRAPVSYSSRSN